MALGLGPLLANPQRSRVRSGDNAAVHHMLQHLLRLSRVLEDAQGRVIAGHLGLKLVGDRPNDLGKLRVALRALHQDQRMQGAFAMLELLDQWLGSVVRVAGVPEVCVQVRLFQHIDHRLGAISRTANGAQGVHLGANLLCKIGHHRTGGGVAPGRLGHDELWVSKYTLWSNVR